MNRPIVAVLIAGALCACVSTRSATARAAVRAGVTAAPEHVPSPSTVAGFDVAAAAKSGISKHVLELALGAVSCAALSRMIALPRTLTLIDYSRPSIEPRLWVFDVRTGDLLFKELVAHGKNTGDNLATRFSDDMDSLESSLGLFVARETYVGDNGYSLRLDGLEPGFNGHARDRGIVMHGAAYVDSRLATKQGRIGRSWGCPALPVAVARQVIDAIRGGGAVFSYYPDGHWLNGSALLNGCADTTIASR